jgi:uncharacterized protein
MDKPVGMFDRNAEWDRLTRFVSDPGTEARLGVVSGRRRQGKTYLLRALCHAAGGLYFSAEQASDAESLRHLGSVLADHLRAPAPFAFGDWRGAVDALLALGNDRPLPVVIDEFPYLVKANQSLPSVIQNALAPLRPERENSGTRLLLCGSAMSFMGKLLTGNAPLRGRAGLELVVHTLDHQLARQFWGIDDLALAVRVNAILGGTPAYRREFARDDVPAGPADFDDWVTRTVLSPASPLFREARYLLADELDVQDSGLYHSVLAAIADGNATRGGIAGYLGRKSGDLAHPLTVLEDAGLVSRDQDVFRDNRTTFRITEPLITFYHAVMRPIWSDLEHTRSAGPLWRRAQQRFAGNVLGPHFERICRYWTRHLAGDDVFGDYVNLVGSGTVHDTVAKRGHEVDVVAFGLAEDNRRPILALGEVKWGDRMGMSHLDRLRHIRALLTAQGRHGAATAKLACYSGVGFTDELQARAASSPEVVLVGLADIYARGGA